MKNRTFLRVAAVCLAVPAGAVLAAGPALAAGDVVVTNTETIQAHLDATGKVKDARVYDQLAFTGKGTVDVANPVSSKGLRNLDGFGGYDVKDGKLVTKVNVDGDKRLRTVSDFDKTIPLTIAVTYLLNGKEVAPGKVVGATGDLEVRYRVENVTATSQQISFDDGTGQQVTKDAQVVIPMVGSLTTVLPSSFTDVSSAQANLAGDGRGGTKLSFTMTLFGPIGSATAEFGYKARIKDGQVPAASISALPVSPLDSPSFKGGAESYKGGADTGVQLTAGAEEIDANLLKLRDGAGQLLAGLIQLRDGADQLNAGLAGEAAPGAAKLSAGAAKLQAGTGALFKGASDAKAGVGVLAAGAHQLTTGSSALAVGTNDLADGSDTLAAGASELSNGLGQIVQGINSLPTDIQSDPGFQQLKGALTNIRAGIGSASDSVNPDPKTLNAAINTIMFGIKNPRCVKDNPEDAANPCGVKEALESLSYKLSHGDTPAVDPTVTHFLDGSLLAALQGDGGLDGTNDGVGALQAIDYLMGSSMLDCDQAGPLGQPACLKVTRNNAGTVEPETANKVLTGIRDNIAKSGSTKTALYALNRLIVGIDGGQIGKPGQLVYPQGTIFSGLEGIRAGLTNPACDTNNPTNPANPCGIKEAAGLVSGGIDQLVAAIADELGDVVFKAYVGAGQVSDGAGQLADGAGQVAAGAGKVAGGAKQLEGGVGQLGAGLGKIKDGAGQLDDGAGQLATGASQLHSGLNDAAVGSGKLADGLTTAVESAPQLKDGAQKLSDEGTKKLVEAGKGTAADYGEKYALIVAGAERAKTEGMAYGAPEGATGVTAYSLELAGMNGEGDRNVGRGLGALVILGLGTGAAALVRRRFV